MLLGTYHRLGVHIYASDLEVIRRARRRLKAASLHDHSPLGRRSRKAFYRQMLKHHHDARHLAQTFRL